jgi:glutamate dehydrogenase/leucine dehydrogenase
MLTIDIDIYAPCALGATVNSETIPQLKCSIIAGAAHNQLAEEKVHGRQLIDKGIIYAPDFLINAGGLINVYSELKGYNREQALAKAEKIYDFVFNNIADPKAINTRRFIQNLLLQKTLKTTIPKPTKLIGSFKIPFPQNHNEGRNKHNNASCFL